MDSSTLDPSALAWMLRVEQTEELYRQRLSELEHRTVEQQEFAVQLGRKREVEVDLHVKLLKQQEHLARTKHQCMSTAREAANAQQHLEDGSSIKRLRTLNAAAEQGHQSIKVAIQNELRRMARFQEALDHAEQGPSQMTAELQHKLIALKEQLAQEDVHMPDKFSATPLNARAAKLQALMHAQTSEHQDAIAKLAELRKQKDELQIKVERTKAQKRIQELQAQLEATRRERDDLNAQQAQMDCSLQQSRRD